MRGPIEYPTLDMPLWEPEPLPLTIHQTPPHSWGYLDGTDGTESDDDDPGPPGSHVIVIDLV